MDSISGQHIKSYELRDCLGTGGFGAVYKAWQTTVGREVAIKIILPDHANQADFIRRFESEAQLVARLEHPYITPLYDYWRDPDGAYLVMRWLRGGSLRDALQNGPFDLPAVALLLDQVAAALSLAHRNAVIHRDIKPGNILLDDEGNAYLTDFGIAKDLTLPGNNTQQDAIVGSLDYISPEQARSEPVTPRTDIYSLGVTLYEMITGQHPFANMSSIERLYKHITEPLPEIDTIERSLQTAVNHVIQKATAKNPEHRYPDALALAADFREAIGMNRSSTTIEELLTQREHEILQMIIDGLSNKEIAQRLTVTLSTVKWHVYQIYSKLGVRSRVQAIVRARELNLIIKPGESVAAVSIPTEDFHPQNPYKGLLAFRSADNQDFFGREKLVAKLLKRWSETGDYSRFLAVVGPSGSGKSSLVKAGLIPALWRGELPGSEKWFIAEMLPGAHPLEQLEVALTRVATHQGSGLNEHLRRDSRGLVRIAGIILPDEETELVLVIDQFEEVFTLLEDEAERTRFLDLLYAAVTEPRSRIRVVITLRADFYDRPLHYPQFGELVRTRLETIMPLSAEELERAIVRPAERVGVTFEPGLVAAIIGDVNYQPGALPLLQYALTELFERRKGRLLPREVYQEIGGTVGALAKRAETIYLSLSDSDKELTRQIFLRLVTLGEGTEDTRRRTFRSELLGIQQDSDPIEELLDSFAAYRLLSLDNDTATRQPTVEVAHEALIREWDRLKLWLNENRAEIQMQRQLSSLASDWTKSKANPSFLLRGSRLANFEAWAKETSFSLTAEEGSFLRASSIEHERETQAEAERQAREIRLEQRSRNFLRGLVAVLLLATLGAFGLTGLAISQRNLTQQALATSDANFRISQARELVGYARDNLDTDSELSTLLALQAVNMTYAIDGSVLHEAESMLHQAVQGLRTPLRFAAAENLELFGYFAGFSPDGTRFVYPLESGNMFGKAGVTGVVDARTGQFLYQLPGDVWSPYVSATNQVIIGVPVGDTMELQLWDISANDHPTFISSAVEPYELWHSEDGTFVLQADTISVSQDLRYLFAAMTDDRNRIWDLTTGEEIVTAATRNIPDEAGPTFSPDGTWLANVNSDLTLSILDTNTWEELVRLSAPRTGLSGSEFTFSQNGERIVRISSDNTNSQIIIWDTTTGAELYSFYYPRLTKAVSISMDGSRVAVAAPSGQVTIWNVTTQEEELTFGASDNVIGVTFSPDSTRLATIHSRGQVLIWDLVPQREVQTLLNHDSDEIYAEIGLGFSPDGQRLIATGTSTTPNVWDVQTGQKLLTLTGHTERVTSAKWSADGTTLATAAGNTVNLWDATTGTIRFTLAGHTGWIYSIAFSPDSNHLATSSQEDATVRIWNVQTGELELTITQEGAAQSRGVAWSPDGLHIANTTVGIDAQHGCHLYIRNALTGEIERDIAIGDVGIVGLVTYSPDGARILTTAVLEQVYHVWDAQTGEKLLTLPGHGVNTTGIAFTPDGTKIVTGGLDNRAQVWDANTGELLFDLFTTGMTTRLAMSPDGSHLAIQDDTSTTWIYVLRIEDLIALAESRMTRWWTVEECQQYLHTDTCPPQI